MNNLDLNILATYNAEVARGLMHTEAWQIKMMELQARFNQERDNLAKVMRGQTGMPGVPHE